MDTCKICSSNFEHSPDALVLCQHKGGFVHMGCCVDRCSMDKTPCTHCKCKYVKEKK